MGQPLPGRSLSGYGPPAALTAAPRADVMGAVLLIIGGIAGVAQLFLPWRTVTVDPVGTGVPAVDDGSITGWRIYRLIRAVPGPGADLSVVMYTVLGAAVGGGALILLGLAMMMPVNHRPLGLAALLISILLILGSCWMLVRARSIFDAGLSGLFDQAQIGWYLFLACGVLAFIGALKALTT
ncbi:MAG TPA: hypothetical protein VES60_14505 [Nakamurella sp.]|nr:hypothetical protein [Nakamurella sp.]